MAADAVLITHSERAFQHISSCFTEAAQFFGQEVYLKKTEVLHQHAPHEEYCPPHIIIGWRWSIGSPTWNAPSGQMLRSTRKLTIGLQKQAVHLADYTNMGGTTDTWRKPQRFVCLEPLFLPHFYMNQTYRQLISATYNTANISTSATSAPSLTSTGVTSSPILEFFKRQPSLVLRPVLPSTILNIHWSDFITNIGVL